MIVRSGHPFTLRDLFDRFGLISIQRRVGRYCRPRLNPRRHTFAALGVWSLVSASPGAAPFVSATGANGSTAFAQSAGRIPRMRALMNWASAGTHRYPTASGAGGRA
jgi:hypothetical protein